MVWAMEDPVGREEMLVYHVLAQEAASEVPIVLYGHLADVLFGGMPRHMLIKLASELPLMRDPIVGFYDFTQTGVPPRSTLGRLLVAAYYRGRNVPPPAVTTDEQLPDEAHLHLSPHDPLNTALLAALGHPTEVSAMERIHARAGIRLASLFHDLEVARWAFRVPDRLKIRGLRRKYILHQVAATILPQAFANRPKGMIRIAQNHRLWRVVEAMAAELFTPESVAMRGLFDYQDILRLTRAPRRRATCTEQFYRVWTLLLTEIWCRTFIDTRGEICTLTANPYTRKGPRAAARPPSTFPPRPLHLASS
jgi:asparagine synthase (glutamine-hydrolysing)